MTGIYSGGARLDHAVSVIVFWERGGRLHVVKIAGAQVVENLGYQEKEGP